MREPGFGPARFHHLRTGVIAGGPVAEELVRRVRRWCDVQIAYGLPEAATVSVTRFTDPEEKRVGTVGRPLPGVELRVVDAITGAPRGAAEVGEVLVRGPNVTSGFARMPGETARAFSPDGFLRTGDLGALDDDGYLRIVGHAEAILRSGYRIVPREVEVQLRAHPAVSDVRVIGVPHEVLGELVCACVVPVEGALVTGEELKDFARDSLADYKVPDMVRFFDALPGQAGVGERAARRELERTVALEQTSAGL
jgi:acyl-CoA synthetase (AMP-forming)/AMP-acid ligase II